jgi:hypothetical protein
MMPEIDEIAVRGDAGGLGEHPQEVVLAEVDQYGQPGHVEVVTDPGVHVLHDLLELTVAQRPGVPRDPVALGRVRTRSGHRDGAG